MFFTVVLHCARPINVRQQRRVFQTHDLQQLWRGEQQIIALLMQRCVLRVDANLELPDRRESQRHGQNHHVYCPAPHFRFLREKIMAAAASTTLQYTAAYNVFCRINARGIATPCATAPVTLKFSKFGST